MKLLWYTVDNFCTVLLLGSVCPQSTGTKLLKGWGTVFVILNKTVSSRCLLWIVLCWKFKVNGDHALKAAGKKKKKYWYTILCSIIVPISNLINKLLLDLSSTCRMHFQYINRRCTIALQLRGSQYRYNYCFVILSWHISGTVSVLAVYLELSSQIPLYIAYVLIILVPIVVEYFKLAVTAVKLCWCNSQWIWLLRIYIMTYILFSKLHFIILKYIEYLFLKWLFCGYVPDYLLQSFYTL